MDLPFTGFEAEVIGTDCDVPGIDSDVLGSDCDDAAAVTET
jgi:hypothetical protein